MSAEYRLPVERFSPPPVEIETVAPDFVVGDVEYYRELPTPPAERKLQTLLPMRLVGEFVGGYIDAWNSEHPDKPKTIGWRSHDYGIGDPRYGTVEHYATVEYANTGEITHVVDDTVVYQDGKIDPRTGIATPGAVIAPIEKRRDGYYVHCFWQWRPVLWDKETQVPPLLTDPADIEHYKALNSGEWVLTLPGGYAGKVRASFQDTATEEALEEGGLRIHKPAYTEHGFNRARVATKIGVGYSTFEKVGKGTGSEGELLSGIMAVRIDKFRSADAMAMAAVNFAREELGLVRSQEPLSTRMRKQLSHYGRLLSKPARSGR